jgi:hypothetical protein
MSYDIVDQDVVKISRTTYFKGMKELADKKFIAETMIQNYYFINPDYMFNGDRLTFIIIFPAVTLINPVIIR